MLKNVLKTVLSQVNANRLMVLSFFIAVLISIPSYPIWKTTLDIGSPIQVKVAPETKIPLNMYLDGTSPKDSLPHARLLSRAVKDFQWKISILPQASKNPNSKSNEVSILSITTGNGKYNIERVDLAQELAKNPGWLSRKLSDLEKAASVVSTLYNLGDPSKPFTFYTSKRYVKISLLKHAWSGKVAVTINDEVYGFDLYAIDLSKQDIKLEVIHEKKDGDGTFLVDLNDASGKKVSFFTGQKIKVSPKEVSILGQTVSPDINGDYIIPTQFLNKKRLAVAMTIVTFIILSVFFSTFVHLLIDLPLFNKLLSRYDNQTADSLIFIITSSITVSTFWVFTFYPASLSADASSSWISAIVGDYNNWWPPLFTFLIAGHQNLFGEQNTSLFAFIQGFLFWFSILYLLRTTVRSNSNFAVFSIALILFPPLWCLSARILIDTWCASFALLSAALLIQYIQSRNRYKLCMMIISLALTIATRHNAILLAIVPILTLNYCFQNSKKLWKKLVFSLLILTFTIGPSKVIDHLPQVKRSNLLGIALFNQYIGTLSRASPHMDASSLQKERLETDAVFGDGKFKEVMSNYGCISGDYIWVLSPPIIDRFELKKNSDFTIKKVVSTAFAHPISYLSHRVCNLSYILQIPTLTLPYYYDILYPDLVGYPNSQIPVAKQWVEKILSSIVERFDIVFRIWVFLLLSIPILVVSFKTNDYTQVVLGTFNLIYFFSYLIPDSAADWRYLMPNYILSIISIIVVIDKVIQKGQDRITFKNQGKFNEEP